MEIKRHFAFAAEKHPELVHYLNMTFAPWKRGEIVSSMDIKESDFRWPTIAAYLKLHGIPSYARQIVKQVQHFLPKFQLVFSSQDTSWDDC